MFANKGVVITVGLGAAAVILSGCAVGTGNSTAQGVTYDPNAKLSGSLSVMGFGAGDEIATTRVDLAKLALGDVSVSLIEGELDMQQFLSSIASGKPPELVYADRVQIGSLAARGAIIPLDDCIEGEGIATDDFVPAAIDQVTFDGSIYGIPEFNSVQLVMANGDLLSAADLDISDVDGSDPEAMTEANAALTESSGGKLSVIGVDSKLPEFLPLWVQARGGKLLSEDGRTAYLDSDEAVDALSWAASIYDDQGGFSAVKSFRDSADFFGAGNQFASSTLGAMPMEQWYLNVLNDVSPDAPLEFTTVKDDAGDPIAYASGSAWAIPAGTDNPQAACRWARTMTAVDTWTAAAQARLDARNAEDKPFTGILTANAAADEKVESMVTSGGEPWDSGVEAMYDANDHTFSLPANPADAEFINAMQDAVNKVLNGQAEPEAALGDAQKVAQKALDSAWAKFDKD